MQHADLLTHFSCLTQKHFTNQKKFKKKLNELKLLHYSNAEDWNAHLELSVAGFSVTSASAQAKASSFD